MSHLAVALVLLVAPALLCAAADGERRSRPFLFLKAADVERARQMVASDPLVAELARDLVARARAVKPESLPPLDRTWWEAARAKPWRDTYPEVFHHTLTVPQRWASAALDCAQAGLLERSPELSAKARRLLLSLAGYTFEFEHYDVGMNYTVWGVSALEAYDILYDGFAAGERATIDAFFDRMLAAVTKNDDYWVKHEPGGPLNNHYAWHKLCRLMIGLFYGRPKLVEEALRGPKGVDHMLRHGFQDDGLWLEGSIPYQFAATSAFLRMAELLENAGSPLSLYRTETDDGRTLRQFYDALIPLLFPDRTLPTIGDCYGRRPHVGLNGDWEILCRRFVDPRYAWLIRDSGRRAATALFRGPVTLPAGEMPEQRSRLWPEYGYAALRSVEGRDYWSGRGWTAFTTFSNAPVHANADKLSLILWADGHLWLPDCEARPSAEHSFSAAVQSQLNRATLCHNVLLVDGKSQRHPADRLDLLEYAALPSVKRITTADLRGQLYPGVRQVRTLIVRPEYVLDVLEVRADEPHDLAWLTHVDGTPAAGSVQTWQPVSLPAGPPWSYLRAAERADAGQTWWEEFEQGGKRLRVDVSVDGLCTVVRCGFPRDDAPSGPVLPMRMLQRRAASALFAAVYRSGGPFEPAQVTMTPGELQTWDVAVRVGPHTWSHRVPRMPAPR